MGAILTCMVVVSALQEGVAYSENPTATEVEQGIRAVWPESLANWAVRVADCESDLGQNPMTYQGYYKGTFQLGPSWQSYFERRGYLWETILYDPYYHAMAAYVIYLESGPGAWPVCGRS